MLSIVKTLSLVATIAGLAFTYDTAIAQIPAKDETSALVTAAKAEGEVLYYTGATENIAKRISDTFTAKYGVKASFVRTPGVTTIRRFATEAEAGTFAVDFYLTSSGAVEFAPEAARKGWIEPIATAGIPVVRSGQFPARFIVGNTAIIQLAPWGISYNSEKLKGADIPRDWPDLLLPKFKGQILIPDPRSSDPYSEFWGTILDRLGESFLTKLREQNPRFYSSGVPSTNALAAGEGLIAVPAVGGQLAAVKEKGAPVDMSQPSLTVGVEMQITLTHRTKAKHPNAARLFADFVMSPEGNKIFNSDPGSLSVYDTTGLPKQYESPKANATARRDLIAKLLGAL